MHFKKLVAELQNSKTAVIYISGKTSTGKTTLANQLADALGYSIVSFDPLVRHAVVEKFQVMDVSYAYIVAYRDDGPEEWRLSFIEEAKSKIHPGVILEGAVANPHTLQSIVSEHINEFTFIYIHPSDLEGYKMRITKRFIEGATTNTTGLPKDFWSMVSEDVLNDFKMTGILSSKIESIIDEFAKKSQAESAERLRVMKNVFTDIKVIDLMNNESGKIYHGTTIKELEVIKPFKRYTPGGPELADQIPPRIYATYDPAFAVAHSFPWSSDDGVDITLEDDVVTIVVPKAKQQVLEQSVCIYTLPDDTFEHTKEEEMGLTYHSIEDVVPIESKCFDSVTEAMRELGGNIKII